MSARLPLLHPIESIVRRVIGAFQCVDAVTQLPVAVAATVAVRGATIAGKPVDIAHQHSVRIRQNRSGQFVILTAPFFESYTNVFDDPGNPDAPEPPPETLADPLRLQLAVTDAGPHYLPQEFAYDLPRALEPRADNSVFRREPVALYRTPSAPVQEGWAILRVLVTEAGVAPPNPLPGVLLRVFRSPRAAGDVPLGAGMTEWRGRTRGEALVPITRIERFRPGTGAAVIETSQAIELEATRLRVFTGAPEQLPDVTTLLAGTDPELIRPPDQPPSSRLAIVRPATTPPLLVQAGREYVVELAMP